MGVVKGHHQPVLLAEVIHALQPRSGGIYVDCTFGRGGHAQAILNQIGVEGHVIGIDKDPQAISAGAELASGDPRLSVSRGSFTILHREVESRGYLSKVDGILFDLGVSSPQFDTPELGFSFCRDGPLDMRMDPDTGASAAQWLNHADQGEIARVLKTFGEERYAKRIAGAIVGTRGQNPITTTHQLAEIVTKASPTREREKHPATRTFQAIRIFVNRELDDLREVLAQVLDVLAIGGRLVVISFHSLEDRLVKRFIRDKVRGDPYPPDLPVPETARRSQFRLVGRPVRPSV
ncbi:MAG: 16S rRNA (cytosine(1402)-N(4))-methyltransferase RsmH, partial [Gammaproteobacteria bacterium]|nr:16S rRNA (cytosine(1402)-N(4))-methyltransferase RsmH [Gammaproteobacteria bacterium]